MNALFFNVHSRAVEDFTKKVDTHPLKDHSNVLISSTRE